MQRQYVIVLPDGAGHRYAYGRRLVDGKRSTDQVWMLVDSADRTTDAYQIHLSCLEDRPDVIIESVAGLGRMRGRDVFALIAQVVNESAMVVALDADLYMWDIAFSSQTPRSLRALIMRPYRGHGSIREGMVWMAKSLLLVAGWLRGHTRDLSFGALLSFGSPLSLLYRRATTAVSDPMAVSGQGMSKEVARVVHGLSPDDLVVGLVGSTARRKNPIVAVHGARAAASVLNRGGDAVLLVASCLEESLRAEILAAGDTDPPVRILMYSNYLPDHEYKAAVAACDVICALYDNEGSSGVVHEAISAKVPVVAAGSRTLRRLVTVLGAGVEAELSSESVARAIVDVIQGVAPASGCEVEPDGAVELETFVYG